MNSEDHRKAVSNKQRQITKLRNQSKESISLEEKLIIKKRINGLNEELRQFKLDYFELVTG